MQAESGGTVWLPSAPELLASPAVTGSAAGEFQTAASLPADLATQEGGAQRMQRHELLSDVGSVATGALFKACWTFRLASQESLHLFPKRGASEHVKRIEKSSLLMYTGNDRHIGRKGTFSF